MRRRVSFWHLIAIAVVALVARPILTGDPPVMAAGPQDSKNVHRQWSVTELANVDIMGAELTPGRSGNPAVAYRITIGVETTTVFNCQIDDGASGSPIEFDFNDGTALTAGRWYTFVLGVNNDYQYDFQVETGADVTLIIDEVSGGKL